MRILHVIATLNPASGGPAASVRSLIEFSPAGYSNEVVTLDPPGAPFLNGLSFPVHALGPTATKYGLNRRLLPWLRQNRSRFNGVIVNGLWQYCGLAASRALAGNTPYIVFAHGMLDPYFKRRFPFKHLKKSIYWYVAEYWNLCSASRVLFTTARESELARQSFRLNRWSAQVVPFGASRPETTPEFGKQAFYASFPKLQGRRFILFLGRINRKKGCDLLIEAFIQAAALDPDLHLAIAGPDEQHWRASLQRRIARAGLDARVHWTGPIYGDQKWGAYQACEAFILPSHQENFGIAVAEAMACGKPALLSNQVNIAPEISHAGAALMEPDTVQGTLQLFARWIQLSPQERQQMGSLARNTFETRYDMRTNAAAIMDLFRTSDAEPRPIQALDHA
ncbi:MAG TPA: glycosyltransferase [Granulicella sp.]|jgi:glycosyltransferase involved in cell wall biosynthesis|nr:glycosyltransferase [Granulicella sp.]